MYPRAVICGEGPDGDEPWVLYVSGTVAAVVTGICVCLSGAHGGRWCAGACALAGMGPALLGDGLSSGLLCLSSIRVTWVSELPMLLLELNSSSQTIVPPSKMFVHCAPLEQTAGVCVLHGSPSASLPWFVFSGLRRLRRLRMSRLIITMMSAQRMNTPTSTSDKGNINQQMRLNTRMPVMRRLGISHLPRNHWQWQKRTHYHLDETARYLGDMQVEREMDIR